MADGAATGRKHIRIERTYHNKAEEGWVKQGRVFNVGKEHTKGLGTVTATRANALVQAKLAAWHTEGEPVKSAGANDPVVLKEDAARKLEREARPRRQAVDPARRTKVESPAKKNPQPSRKVQDEKPAAPEKFTAPRRPAPNTSQTKVKPGGGGKTGADADSQSSSAAGPASGQSTGQPRGLRRGEPVTQKGVASGGARSTKATVTSRKTASSTAPTSLGGATTKASESSED